MENFNNHKECEQGIMSSYEGSATRYISCLLCQTSDTIKFFDQVHEHGYCHKKSCWYSSNVVFSNPDLLNLAKGKTNNYYTSDADDKWNAYFVAVLTFCGGRL